MRNDMVMPESRQNWIDNLGKVTEWLLNVRGKIVVDKNKGILNDKRVIGNMVYKMIILHGIILCIKTFLIKVKFPCMKIGIAVS